MRSLVMAIFVFGCGGHPAGAPATAGSAAAAADCEPGRCLEDISQMIAGHKKESRACYDKARAKDPKVAGRVIINFTIDAEGNVGEASQGGQDDQLQDADLVACLTDVVKSTKFAKSSKGKTTRAYHRFEVGAP